MAYTLQDKCHEDLYGNYAGKREDVMKTLTGTLTASIAWALPALASGRANDEGGSILIVLFFGFGALVLVTQLFPGVGLFAVILRELLTGARRKSSAAAGKAGGNPD